MKMVTELGLLMGQFGMWVEAKNGQWIHDSHIPVLPWKTVGRQGKARENLPNEQSSKWSPGYGRCTIHKRINILLCSGWLTV